MNNTTKAKYDMAEKMLKVDISLEEVALMTELPMETLKKIGLDVPQVTELAYRLQQAGCPVDVHMISEEACVASLTKLLSGKTGGAAWQS